VLKATGLNTECEQRSTPRQQNRHRPSPLRGRDEQVARISASIEEIENGHKSKLLLMQDEPGSGKTRLLLKAIGLAKKAGFAVVSGMSPFAGIPIDAPAESVPHVRRGGSVNGSAVSERPDPLRDLRVGLRGALERGPSLVVLDDLNLVETSVLIGLRDLIASVSARAVLWMLVFGPEDPGPGRQPADLVCGRFRVERMPKLTALTGEPLAQLVADHLDAVPDPDIVALAEGVGGNPRAVIELVRGLAEDGDVYVVEGRARLRELPAEAIGSRGRIRVPAPVPPRFTAMVQRNLRSLSPLTTNVLKLAAILGSPFAPMDLAVMLDKSPAELLPAFDEAFGRGILVDRANDFAFRGDPIWRVILDSVPSPMVVLLHKQAATRLMSRDDGMEAAALHLVHVAGPGDEEAVRIISAAATSLLTSDPATAASLALRGMELVEPEDGEHARLALTAVEALVRASHVERAIATAKKTIVQAASVGRAPVPAQAGAVAALRSWLATALLLQGHVQDAWVATSALTDRPGDPGGRAWPELTRLVVEFLTDDSGAVRHAAEILTTSDHCADAVTAGALTIRAWDRWRGGRFHDAIDLLGEAVETDRGSSHIPLLDPQWMLASILTRAGDFEKAAVCVEAAARKVPASHAAAVTEVLMASVHLAQGRLDEAERSARTGIEGLDGMCAPLLAPPAWRVLVLVALRRGSPSEAEEHLKSLEERYPRDSSRPWWPMRFLLRAQVADAQDGAKAAIEALAEIWASAGARRELVLQDPSVAACCVRWAMEADRPDIAKMVVNTAKSLCAGNEDVPALRVGMEHAQGLLLGEAEVLGEASRSYRDPWARAMAAEDHARLLLSRDDREGAIVELEQALDGYAAMGDEADVARVRADLRRLGVRRRHWKHAKRPVSGWDSLTGAEQRVAELVAKGLTNRQVASQLYVSPHTVGFHLRQVYRKLHLRSRQELIRYKA
jgi:DNA-binding CsgD family transcriptional regulator/tetratricopeptide (TPR) repeat protein